MSLVTGSEAAGVAAWSELERHRDQLVGGSLRDLFAADPERGERLAVGVGDLWVDYSKQPVTDETISLLVDLAAQRDVAGFIGRMLSGDRVNTTEDRPALHTALRAGAGTAIVVDGTDVVPGVRETLGRMADVAVRLRSGQMSGATGRPITAMVSLGIGGSHLGPAMATEAMAHLAHPELDIRFASNLDGADIERALDGLDPATTLILVCSKTFTTPETMVAAETARAWLVDGVGGDLSAHLAAATAATDLAADLGVSPELTFHVPDWVGGRFSLPSAVGLSVMASVGPEAFAEMLAGMRIVDEHLASCTPDSNGPMLLGLLDVWHRSFLGASSLAVVPYGSQLGGFPPWLQQVSMESLGKRAGSDGGLVAGQTGPVVWGAPGTDGQHAFFQMLHQGTEVVPCDLIGFARPLADPRLAHHDALMANLFAQAEALAFGLTADEAAATGVPPDLVAHRTFPGNRPSTTILAPELTPSVLGQLVSLYEHRTVVAGAVWGINPFDQWGVELGKSLAVRITDELAADEDRLAHDSSTNSLIRRYLGLRGRST
ncbi:MAG: glucose-6-phosphate isomerase [Acidimicrobiaceae bacterium]|nr:glucose-6-phosphate isomerase [Acidimicrobiaceae bacterium]